MSDDDNGEARKLTETVETRRRRREKWEKEGERPLWKNMSMIGALGWLIVAPALIGVFAGRWLDGQMGTGITLTGALTVLGVGLGGYLAWKRMNEE